VVRVDPQVLTNGINRSVVLAAIAKLFLAIVVLVFFSFPICCNMFSPAQPTTHLRIYQLFPTTTLRQLLKRCKKPCDLVVVKWFVLYVTKSNRPKPLDIR
jgi:hypothetical protein